MSTRLFILVSLFTCFCSNLSVSHASQQQATCSGQRCVKEAHNGVLPEGEIYKVVAPLGKGIVQSIRQAKRLDTLEGKTIAIVGGSFMASVTHPELKLLIMAEFPMSKYPFTTKLDQPRYSPVQGYSGSRMKNSKPL